MTTIEKEEGLLLPSELIMIHQWQQWNHMFPNVCWSVPDKNKPAGLAQVFTSFCLN